MARKSLVGVVADEVAVAVQERGDALQQLGVPVEHIRRHDGRRAQGQQADEGAHLDPLARPVRTA